MANVRKIALKRIQWVLKVQKESKEYVFRSPRWADLAAELAESSAVAPEVSV